MYDWVRALLDPEDIVQSHATAKKHITPPPKYDQFPGKPILPRPSISKGSKSRSTRSASPSKVASLPRASLAASPKKRQSKAAKEANLANANAASAALQSALDDAASTVEPESVNGETFKFDVDSSIDANVEMQTTHRSVTMNLPPGSATFPPGEDGEEMLETAKSMVEEARALEEEPPSRNFRKRKVEEVDPEELDGDLPVQPAKKAKVLEEKLKREEVRTRALFGVTATLAIAYVTPAHLHPASL